MIIHMKCPGDYLFQHCRADANPNSHRDLDTDFETIHHLPAVKIIFSAPLCLFTIIHRGWGDHQCLCVGVE